MTPEQIKTFLAVWFGRLLAALLAGFAQWLLTKPALVSALEAVGVQAEQIKSAIWVEFAATAIAAFLAGLLAWRISQVLDWAKKLYQRIAGTPPTDAPKG